MFLWFGRLAAAGTEIRAPPNAINHRYRAQEKPNPATVRAPQCSHAVPGCPAQPVQHSPARLKTRISRRMPPIRAPSLHGVLHQMPRRPFEIKEVGPVLLIKPVESRLVDRDQINFLSDELLEYLAVEKPEQIVFSLKHMQRYSSEAIGGLIRIERQLSRTGGQMKLCANEEIREVFRVTGLDGNVFDIYDTESDAIAAFFEHGGDLFDE